MSDKNIILWIEDKIETISEYKTLCEDSGLKVEIVSTPNEILDFFEEKENKKRIVLIIMDTMLAGVKNLKSIRIEDADTEGGYNAGWIIIERLLRAEEKINEYYTKIPILMLSSRDYGNNEQERLEDLNSFCKQNKLPNIEYLEKYAGDKITSWQEKLGSSLKKITGIKLKKGDQ